jgi:hypothetical protein
LYSLTANVIFGTSTTNKAIKPNFHEERGAKAHPLLLIYFTNTMTTCTKLKHSDMTVHMNYEMRFDEVLARFGEFGNFLVGNILDDAGLEKMLKI